MSGYIPADNRQLEYISNKSGIDVKILESFRWTRGDAWPVYNGLMTKPHKEENKQYARDEILKKINQLTIQFH